MTSQLIFQLGDCLLYLDGKSGGSVGGGGVGGGGGGGGGEGVDSTQECSWYKKK